MRTQYAFSLIELMIAVAIMGVLVTMVLPDIQYAINNNRITTRANELISAFHSARSTAVTYRKDVRIDPRNGDWSEGWEIWRDDNKNNAKDDDEIIKVFEYSPRVSVLPGQPSKNILITASVPSITYNTKGEVDRNSQGIIFTVCMENRQSYQPTGRRIRIGNTGQVSMIDKNFSCSTVAQ